MSSHRLRRTSLMIAVVTCFLLLAVGITMLQENLIARNKRDAAAARQESVQSAIALSKENYASTMREFDQMNRARIRMLCWFARICDQNNQELLQAENKESADSIARVKTQMDREALAALAENAHAAQIIILDQTGNVVSSAYDTRHDFTEQRFDALRSVFAGEGDDAFVEVYESDDVQLRYYAEKMNDELEIVLEQNLSSLAAMVDFGMSQEALSPQGEETASARQTAFAGDAYPYADAENAMPSGEWFTVVLLLLINLIVLVLFAFYGASQKAAMRTNAEGRANRGERNSLIRRLAALGMLSLAVVFSVSYYAQTLSAYSQITYENSQQIETLKSRLERNAENAQALTQWYEDTIHSKTETVRSIIAYSSVLSTPTYESLTQLADALDAREIAIFDEQGDIQLVGGDPTDISLKDTEYNKLRELSALLNGASYVSVVAEDAHGSWQYTGVGKSSYGAQGNLMVLRLDRAPLNALLASTRMQTLLSGIHSTTDSYAIAVSKGSGAFVYHPKENLIGKPALAHGVTADQMREGYCGYLTVEGETCYAQCMETDEHFFYIASPIGGINASRWPFSVMTTALTGFCLLALSLLLCRANRRPPTADEAAPAEQSSVQSIASSRLSAGMVKLRLTSSDDEWHGQGAGHKALMLTKWMLAAYVFFVACVIALRRYIFSPYSIVRYIMDGEWERGLNLFSVTAVFFTASGIATVATAAVWLIRMTEPLLAQKGKTICRLSANALKYATVILSAYYCLSLFGVNTSTLLASAGVLTGIIGLGSRQIISDIMSGLFLIFEGGFQVGDMVQIGGCKGVVLDIGIRVTKVRSSDGSLSIIPNGSIAGVVNLSRFDSALVISYYIDYDEPFAHVKEVMERELPRLADKYPGIRKGPVYLGVTDMTTLRYTIGVQVKCGMADANSLRRSLTADIYELLKQNGIRMSYRQCEITKEEADPHSR